MNSLHLKPPLTYTLKTIVYINVNMVEHLFIHVCHVFLEFGVVKGHFGLFTTTYL